MVPLCTSLRKKKGKNVKEEEKNEAEEKENREFALLIHAIESIDMRTIDQQLYTPHFKSKKEK